ncbi:LysR family transcriptional regulator [Bacillus sp. DNRA2]|uniref:LysR family transcriptional regulator n=1 Tax=Bacillus sp. DNRA2 TaxID=2723053 RepID=UPI00145EED42|nr:LysR family transcriptional regulator [Bacillus sp. DNRA2]NMD70228.1 LysR family transcriptional regulator [Bacillus sp. DNRA2]
MEINWLKTFAVAARYENFRQTAEDLFLTQPAITKHIRRLEEHLNTELFYRHGKSVTLTPAGHRFLPYAQAIIAKYDESFADFAAWKQGYNRKLIITSAPQIASSILPPLLRNFIAENRDIEVMINIQQSYDIGQEISAGRADIGLSRLEPLQKNIHSEMIHEESVILVGPTKNENEEVLSEKTALTRYRLITHNHPDYWDELLGEILRVYPMIRTMAVKGVDISKKFIEAGLGVSFLPLTVVEEEILRGKLVEIPYTSISTPKSSTYVVTKVQTEETKAFISFLKEVMPKL